MYTTEIGKIENRFVHQISDKPSSNVERSTFSIHASFETGTDTTPVGNEVDLMVSMQGSEPV